MRIANATIPLVCLAFACAHAASNRPTLDLPQTSIHNSLTPQKEHRKMNAAEFQTARSQLQAHWLDAEHIALPATFPAELLNLWWVSQSLGIKDGKIQAKKKIQLLPAGLVTENSVLNSRFPWLGGYRLWKFSVPLQFKTELRKSIKDEIAIISTDTNHLIIGATGIQTNGVLDAHFVYTGNDLGVSKSKAETPDLALWAPTAKTVTLLLFKNPLDSQPVNTLSLTEDEFGVWRAHGKKEWWNQYYQYEVEVFVPLLATTLKNKVTDPYSFALSTNSAKSQIIDLDAPETKPDHWDQFNIAKLPVAEKISLYELHVRDFSAADHSIPENLRGKYLAFTQKKSDGMKHLASLAQAGLSHVHLLPVLDFASVNEDPTQRTEPRIPENLPADSKIPQAITYELRDQDAFNWGYDPYHYFAPEGSYAVEPNGATRIREFRAMVQGLHAAGLYTVLDVVFNHTFRGGQQQYSVLDKIVPNYYYRTDSSGVLHMSTCGSCADTATERTMMQKLMIDAVVHWVKNYRIAGFRFDLMGHHTRSSLEDMQKELAALTPENDKIDGKNIYIYGEGWKFGSLDSILPNHSACQTNMFGAGIGTFNDRIRDRITGGSFQSETKANQGVTTGLFYDDNGLSWPRDWNEQRNRLLQSTDVIRVALAGNLSDYRFTNCYGQYVRGSEIDYGGAPTGYAASPRETVNYVSAHDNFDLWDKVQAKAPFWKPGRTPDTSPLEERTRMHKLSLSLVALAQGVPFFHAGSEILRSKSGDNNSYNSSDWFNAIDWSLKTDRWAVGLPTGVENGHEWDFWAPRFRTPQLHASPEDRAHTAEYFRGLMRVRKSSPLFHLPTLDEVQARVRFLESDWGTGQPPGLIAMWLRNDLADRKQLDSTRKGVIAVWNVTLGQQEFTHEALKGLSLSMHPEWTQTVEPRVADAHFDSASGKLMIPPQTLLVYEVR